MQVQGYRYSEEEQKLIIEKQECQFGEKDNKEIRSARDFILGAAEAYQIPFEVLWVQIDDHAKIIYIAWLCRVPGITASR